MGKIIKPENRQYDDAFFRDSNRILPPQNINAERAIVGACFLKAEACSIAMGILRPEMFYSPQNQIMFRAICKLSSANTAVDALTVTDLLRKSNELEIVGNEAGITQVFDDVASIGNVEHYCKIVLNSYKARELIDACDRIKTSCYTYEQTIDEILNEGQAEIFKVYQSYTGGGWRSMESGVNNFIDSLGKKLIAGVSSGYSDLDKLTLGFRGGELIVLASRPSNGKTALVLNIMDNISIKDNGPKLATAIFSLEMSYDALIERMICGHIGISSHKARGGFLSKEEMSAIKSFSEKFKSSPVLIDDKGSATMLEIMAKSRRLKVQHPSLVLIAVDYLTLIQGDAKAENRAREVGKNAQMLKALAKELNVAVLCVAQLSRNVEYRPNNEPILSDLRDSGEIEQHCDECIFVVRPGFLKPVDQRTPEDIAKAKLVLAKNRNGPIGAIDMKFDSETMRFSQLTKDFEFDEL